MRGIEGLHELGLLPGQDGRFSRPERHVLVAAHGRFNKIVISALRGDLRGASDLQQGNTALNIIDFAPDGTASVQAVNLREHLNLGAYTAAN